MLVVKQIWITVVLVLYLQVMAETGLIFSEVCYIWVTRQERNGERTLVPKLKAVFRAEAWDGPDRGAWILSIKEVSCIGRTLLRSDRWRRDKKGGKEETCNKKEQLVPLIACKVVFKPALVVFVTWITI